MLAVIGKFDVNQVSISSKKSTKKRSLYLQDNIESIWCEILKQAAQDGKAVWDSELYRLEGCRIEENILTLDLSTVSVREVLASRRVSGEYELGEQYLPNSLFVCAFIKTKDNKYVFGRTSRSSFGGERIDLIGGTLSHSENEVTDGVTLFNAIYCELEEELNIIRDFIKAAWIRSIVKTNKHSYGIVFEINLDIEKGELVDCFSRRDNNELDDIVFIEENCISDYVEKMGEHRSCLKYLFD